MGGGIFQKLMANCHRLRRKSPLILDGKQRLETIFMFTGVGRFNDERFNVKLEMGDGLDWYDWKGIRRHYPSQRHAFESYKIQTVEVTGDLAEIVDLFVRINSTGKRLTSGEKRHARFYNSPFLKEAERLISRAQNYLLKQKILSRAEIARMKGTELFAELLMSIHNGGPINKKISLDRAIGNESVNVKTLRRLSREFTGTMNMIKGMFPELRQTRFRNTAEYYSLFLLVWEMKQAGYLMRDRRRNKIAFTLLKRLSTGADELREQLRKARPAKPSQRLFSDYLLTVQGDTDSIANRERRRELLKGLIFTLYERKDTKRTFTSEQRRIIWNSEEKHKCPKCRKAMKWDDFTVDHIVAHVKGGKTSLRNAQVMCRSCNSRKGAK